MTRLGNTVVMALVLSATVHSAAAAGEAPDSRLTRALRRILGDEAVASQQYEIALIDLNGDGLPDAVVYLSGGGWCGSGGCNTLVLQRTARGYKVIGDTPTTRLPIKLLRSRHNGWRDLSTWQQGGGNLDGCTATIEFNGWRYRKRGCWPPGELGTKADGPVLLPREDQPKP